MANNAPNMKVVVGADTSQFDRGMRAAKAELRDFGNVRDSLLGKLGEAIGIDTQQVEKMSSAIRGMGRQMQESGSEGTAAFGKLLSSVSSLGAGIAALGIAGVVAGFKALNAEAENFKNTVAGANIELQTQAYISTFKQAMHDVNADVGESVAKAQADWQKRWATFGPRLAANLAAAPGGTATGFAGASVGQPQLQLQRQINQAIDDAINKAKIAEEATGEIYQLERQRKEQAVEIAKINRDIANLMGNARDTSVSVADRQAAIEKIEGLIAQKKTMTLDLENRLAELYVLRSDQAADSIQDADEVLAQQQRAFDVETQIKNEENSLLKIKKSLNKENATANAALQKQLELQKQIAQSRADLAGLNLGVSGALMGSATALNSPGLVLPAVEQFRDLLYAQLGNALYFQVQLDLDKQSFVDMTQELQSLMESLAGSVGDAIGGLVGDLLTGGDAFGNFRNAALSSFGDMATAVGKMAIATGVATLGIKAALESLNGWVAIAAGTALVALGAAVKSGLSNIAAGNYSSSTAVASGSYGSSASNDYVTRDVQVNVTGTLQADGDKLVAVLNNTANKKGYTT